VEFVELVEEAADDGVDLHDDIAEGAGVCRGAFEFAVGVLGKVRSA